MVAVYDDSDKGVYKHKGNIKETKQELKESYNGSNTSGGGQKMGEAQYWDEFMTIGKDSGGEGKIHFGEKWDKVIVSYNRWANEQDLSITANQSKNNGRFDIKKADYLAPDSVMKGKLLDGKYATARSAGNYLSDYNGRTGTYFGAHIILTAYMKLAGALQQSSITKQMLLKLFYLEQVMVRFLGMVKLNTQVVW